jgi:hypothetical protein
MAEQDERASQALNFRLRAEELRAVAEALKNPECYAALMRLAASYDVMARGAEHALHSPDPHPREVANENPHSPRDGGTPDNAASR